MNYDLGKLYQQQADQSTTPRPIVAITGNYGDCGCELATGYYLSVLEAGGCPLVVPPTDNVEALHALLERVDAILLSGGADLNPLWVGENPTPQLGGINPMRDKMELLLVRLAADRQIPMLGICRGMQVMAAAFGGHVAQDMATQRPTDAPPLLKHSQQAPRDEATHWVSIAPDSTLASLLGERVAVNSFHHQAVDHPGPAFRVVARADDDTIEAIESTEHRSLMAVQWHPECMPRESMRPLFAHLVREAASYRKARDFHARHLTLDSHCDTPMFFHRNIDFNRRDPQILVDSRKMAEGGLDASIMVAYLAQQERTPEAHNMATARAHQLLDQLEAMVERCPEARMAFTPAQLRQNKADGFRSIVPGIENAYAFGSDLGQVRAFRQRGVVYATLCHNGHNEICDSARPNARDLAAFAHTNGAEHGGLSAYGRQVVAEMNRLGMVVDLSHGAESSFYDALECSAVPIVCSHSSARALCNHPRNLTDDQLRALAARGGVAQCTFYEGFLRVDGQATIDDALRHILHMVTVAGIDHVGFGTDFDGDGGVPGLADASQLLQLTRRLQAEGFSDQDLAKLWGENFLRVVQQAQDWGEIKF
mgnify:FL=1